MALQTVDRKIPAFSLLFIYMFMISSSGVRCKICQDPQEVSVCPKSAYMWHERSKEFCVTKEEYHCLITEVNTIIECCMSAHNISAGHYPRYNRLKSEIQELECDKEHYMPISYSSNRFLDNGPHHCKYQKSKCNGAGMTTCTDGSTTQDRLCRCDYKNKFKTDFYGPICFPQDDNMCSMATSCMEKHKELNMMYECVNICSEGYYRPEMDCIPLPTSLVPPLETTTEWRQDLTTDSKEKDGMDMSIPITPNDAHGINTVIALVILIILLPLAIIIPAAVIYYYRRKRRYKVPNIHVEKSCYVGQFGTDITIRCRIENLLEGFQTTWKKSEDGNSFTDLLTDSQKYIIENLYITIKQADSIDAGWYACFVEGSRGGEVAIFPQKHNADNVTHVKINEPRVEIKKKRLNEELGTNFTISCKIENVRNYSVIWKKGEDRNSINEVIDVSNSEKYMDGIEGFPSLTVKDADYDDEGLYACFIECTINGNVFVFPRETTPENIARVHVQERSEVKQNYTYVSSAGVVTMGQKVDDFDIRMERINEDSATQRSRQASDLSSQW